MINKGPELPKLNFFFHYKVKPSGECDLRVSTWNLCGRGGRGCTSLTMALNLVMSKSHPAGSGSEGMEGYGEQLRVGVRRGH